MGIALIASLLSSGSVGASANEGVATHPTAVGAHEIYRTLSAVRLRDYQLTMTRRRRRQVISNPSADP